ncbi:DUF1902 domain-containing protein [Thorsellia anophelis]|uniref:Uncharacterized protein n=1 Tax=Thorsellia anophelis DSM 18579 TaxID=1123402 RepID=A0A1I0FW95_9GAMM|nr:DUF1902 domain-containing protein [Thorsellia anophelis]SET61939.1 hypothetical protein SAMN02583745_02896 [Thorsellia anophelis DSM 18579]
MKKTLRCMAYKQDSVYVAVCIDLNLATQADTIDDAIKALEAQILDFLDEAFREPQYTESLLNRKAPLSLVLKYFWITFVISIGKRKGSIFTEENSKFNFKHT